MRDSTRDTCPFSHGNPQDSVPPLTRHLRCPARSLASPPAPLAPCAAKHRHAPCKPESQSAIPYRSTPLPLSSSTSLAPRSPRLTPDTPSPVNYRTPPLWENVRKWPPAQLRTLSVLTICHCFLSICCRRGLANPQGLTRWPLAAGPNVGVLSDFLSFRVVRWVDATTDTDGVLPSARVPRP